MVLVASIAVACSDDETAGQPAAPEGGTQSDGSGMDASVDASEMPDRTSADAPRADGFIDIFDAFPVPDGALGGCVTCIRDRCGAQVNQCLNNDACRAGLQCTFTTCLGTGMPDPACLLGCFMGDPAAALSAVAALMCINSSCGAACMAGGLEGGGEGGVVLDSSISSDGSMPPDGSPPSDASEVDAAGPEGGGSDANPPVDSGTGD